VCGRKGHDNLRGVGIRRSPGWWDHMWSPHAGM
jgi:hypothetical protein